MKKALLTLAIMGSFIQNSICQTIFIPAEIEPDKEYENIYRAEIYSDTLTSSFLIIVKKNVALHKHQFHSEHIYVLSGTGEMVLGEENISIAAGDVLVIPKNTIHSLEVTSRDPIRLISIQAPKYNGKDLILIE